MSECHFRILDTKSDFRDRVMSGQKGKNTKISKREFYIVMSGQFRTLVVYLSKFVILHLRVLTCTKNIRELKTINPMSPFGLMPLFRTNANLASR